MLPYLVLGSHYIPFLDDLVNPLTPKSFCVFERFSAYTRPMGFLDSIFKVIMESAAVLKHCRHEFTGNVIVTLSFCFVELQ